MIGVSTESWANLALATRLTNHYVEWANQEAPLYSTGSYIQYHMLNHNGKEYENLYILIYV